MTGVAWLPVGVIKEVRALLPVWVACMVAVAAGGLTGSRRLIGFTVFAYALGAIALGAHSIGHEYSHRTIGLLLTQPFDRRRLFLTKTGVLGVMLLGLAAVAWTTVFDALGPRNLPSGVQASAVLLLVALFALFVTPCLTMVCRNPLGAVVFTFTIPGLLLLGGELLGIARFGFHAAADVDRARLAFVLRGMFTVCGAAAVASWFLFMRLEAIEDGGTQLHLPGWRSGAAHRGDIAPARSRHAVWLLMNKELRLQQMTFVLVAIYVLVWASLSVLRPLVPQMGDMPLLSGTMLYLGLLSVVIGSMASAEERHLGTLEWQVLLPMAAWQQWAVKAGTALLLAVVLGGGLPLLLARIDPSPDELHMINRAGAEILLVAFVLTSGSLYISSVCSSGMRAVVAALPAIFGLFFFVNEAGPVISWALRLLPLKLLARTLRFDYQLVAAAYWLVVSLAVGWTALLLWLALQNHRSAERGAARVWRQAGWIAASVVAGFSLLTALDIVGRAAWR